MERRAFLASTYDHEYALYVARMDAWWEERQNRITAYMRDTCRIFRVWTR